MATAYFSHDDCLKHETPEGHPEQVARLQAIAGALADPRFRGLTRVVAPLCEDADILLCHPQSYLDHVRATSPIEDRARLDPDTYMSPGSLRAAQRGVGGNIAAIDTVLSGDVANAFVGCRPPGHLVSWPAFRRLRDRFSWPDRRDCRRRPSAPSSGPAPGQYLPRRFPLESNFANSRAYPSPAGDRRSLQPLEPASEPAA